MRVAILGEVCWKKAERIAFTMYDLKLFKSAFVLAKNPSMERHINLASTLTVTCPEVGNTLPKRFSQEDVRKMFA